MFDIARFLIATSRFKRIAHSRTIYEDTFLPVRSARRRKRGIDRRIGRNVRTCEKAADLRRNERTTRFVSIENGDFRTVPC